MYFDWFLLQQTHKVPLFNTTRKRNRLFFWKSKQYCKREQRYNWQVRVNFEDKIVLHFSDCMHLDQEQETRYKVNYKKCFLLSRVNQSSISCFHSNVQHWFFTLFMTVLWIIQSEVTPSNRISDVALQCRQNRNSNQFTTKPKTEWNANCSKFCLFPKILFKFGDLLFCTETQFALELCRRTWDAKSKQETVISKCHSFD